MARYSLLFISLALIALHLPLARAEFDDDDLDDHYRLRVGGPACARDFEIEDDDLDVEADDIELDDRGCNGGEIELRTIRPNSASAFSQVRFFANQAGIGNFLAGRADRNINCGRLDILAGTLIVLVKPETDITTTWNAIYGSGSTLESLSGDRVFLQQGRKYLFQGDDCFFRERNDGSVCFPSHATALLQGGVKRRMDRLQLGDRVLVADGTYSDVFAFTHRAPEKKAARYAQIETEGGQRLVATRGHFVYADGKAVPAGDVRAGMMVRSVRGDVRVSRVRSVKASGLYNPQTVHGDIVVDGIVATTYTTTIQPMVAHALLAPWRAAWSALAVFAAS